MSIQKCFIENINFRKFFAKTIIFYDKYCNMFFYNCKP